MRLAATGQLIDLPLGKTTIGCSPRCDIRIELPGVQPLHCVISENGDEVSARRWAGELWLNGEPVDVAPLSTGDRLLVGSAELEIVDAPHSGTNEETGDRLPVEAPSILDPSQFERAEPGGTDTLRAATDIRDAADEAIAMLQQSCDAWDDVVKRVDALERAQRVWDRQQSEWSAQLNGVKADVADCRRQVEELQQDPTGCRKREAPTQQATEPCADVRKPAEETCKQAAGEGGAVTAETDGFDWLSLREKLTVQEKPLKDRAALFAPSAERGDVCDASGRAPLAPAADPTSFIERYAALFNDESAGEDPTEPHAQSLGPPLVADERIPSGRPTAREVSTGIGDSSAIDNEESVEQYMAKLLQRVRGDSSRVAASQTQAVPSTVSNEPSGPPTTDSHLDAEPDSAPWSARHDTPSSPAPEGEFSADFWMARPSTAAAGSPTDLGALRALANATARRAISTHALRKHRQNMVTKAIVATLAAATSVWLMLRSPAWSGWEFILGCVALLIAAYWAGETCRTLRDSMRLGALEEAGNEPNEPQEHSELPLPIDVE